MIDLMGPQTSGLLLLNHCIVYSTKVQLLCDQLEAKTGADESRCHLLSSYMLAKLSFAFTELSSGRGTRFWHNVVSDRAKSGESVIAQEMRVNYIPPLNDNPVGKTT